MINNVSDRQSNPEGPRKIEYSIVKLLSKVKFYKANAEQSGAARGQQSTW